VERAAQKLLSERRVVKVHVRELGLTLYLAYGAKFDKLYLLIPGRFCSCFSFFFSAFLRRTASQCVHLAALSLAKDAQLPAVEVSLEDFRNKIFPLIFRGLLS